MDVQMVNRIRRAVGNDKLASSITSFALTAAAHTAGHQCGEKCHGHENDHRELRDRARMVLTALGAQKIERKGADDAHGKGTTR